jgi:hypothetical protein
MVGLVYNRNFILMLCTGPNLIVLFWLSAVLLFLPDVTQWPKMKYLTDCSLAIGQSKI